MIMLDFIQSRLKGKSQADWKLIASDAGVPYSTLEKVIYGISVDPRLSSVEPVYLLLLRRESAAA